MSPSRQIPLHISFAFLLEWCRITTVDNKHSYSYVRGHYCCCVVVLCVLLTTTYPIYVTRLFTVRSSVVVLRQESRDDFRSYVQQQQSCAWQHNTDTSSYSVPCHLVILLLVLLLTFFLPEKYVSSVTRHHIITTTDY